MSELIELANYISRGITPKYTESADGFGVINQRCIRNGVIDFSLVRNTDLTKKKVSEDKMLKKFDILINSTGDGTLGRVSQYFGEDNKYTVDSHVTIVRPNSSLINPVFLGFNLFSKQRFIEKLAEGSTGQLELPRISVGNIEVNDVDKELQDLSAILLFNIQNKITLLRQQNQDLEELAQTLFKRWFVEFEFPCLPSDYRPHGQVNLVDMAKVCTYSRVGNLPSPDDKSWFVYVLLCEDGSFYKGMTNDLYHRFYVHYIGEGANHTKTHRPVKVIHWEQFDTQDEARKREEELKTGYCRTWLQHQWDIAKGDLPAPKCQLRMAGKMVESELGEIPEGWKCNELQELVTVKRGGSPRPIQDFLVKEGLPWVKISDATATSSPFLMSTKEFIKEEGLSKTVYLKKGSLILSNSATPGLPKFLELDACIHDGWLYFPKISVITQNYMYLLFLHLKKHIVQQGSGSVFTNLKTDILKEQLLPVATTEIIKSFDSLIDSYFNKIRNNTNEIQTLTQLRDTLLPKLMSGELRVTK